MREMVNPYPINRYFKQRVYFVKSKSYLLKKYNEYKAVPLMSKNLLKTNNGELIVSVITVKLKYDVTFIDEIIYKLLM